MGIVRTPLLPLAAFFRQYLGYQMFRYEGRTYDLDSDNTIGTFLDLLCLENEGLHFSVFWESNILPLTQKEEITYDFKIFEVAMHKVYIMLNDNQMNFCRTYPTKEVLEETAKVENRKSLLKKMCTELWTFVKKDKAAAKGGKEPKWAS